MIHRKTVTLLAAIAVAGALGFELKSVLAEGVPTPNPLYYSGTLTESGTPVNGSRQITVNLWLNGTAQVGEKAICTATTATTPVVNGRFRIALDSSCKGAINANPNVYVEVVDGNTSLGRSPIGAVPYAVEADHAVNATNATTAATANAAGGTLATTLSTIQAQVQAQEHIERASIGPTGMVISQTGTWITGVNHNGTGSYVVSFAVGTFASPPSCVVTAYAGNATPPPFECYNASSPNSLTCTSPGTDTEWSLICVGP